MNIDEIIDDVIRAEGGYVDDPHDSGGKTKYGITEKVARAAGYRGDMRDLPIELAKKIYYREYVEEPGFHRISAISPAIAAEVIDTGVNCGPATAGKFLQIALNAFNQRGTLWPELIVDGGVGQKTADALTAYMKHRAKDDGERVMLLALNCLQGAKYIEISQSGDMKNESFVFGWIRNRVRI